MGGGGGEMGMEGGREGGEEGWRGRAVLLPGRNAPHHDARAFALRYLQIKAAQRDGHVVQLLPCPLVVRRPQLGLNSAGLPPGHPSQESRLRLADFVGAIHAAGAPPKGEGPGRTGQAAGAKGGVLFGLRGWGGHVCGRDESEKAMRGRARVCFVLFTHPNSSHHAACPRPHPAPPMSSPRCCCPAPM